MQHPQRAYLKIYIESDFVVEIYHEEAIRPILKIFSTISFTTVLCYNKKQGNNLNTHQLRVDWITMIWTNIEDYILIKITFRITII